VLSLVGVLQPATSVATPTPAPACFKNRRRLITGLLHRVNKRLPELYSS
jgi:hypothetical protein